MEDAASPRSGESPPDDLLDRATDESTEVLNGEDTSPPAPARRPAGFWIRFWAKMADQFLLVPISYALLAVAAFLHAFGLSGVGAFLLLMASALLVSILYFAHFNSNGRQTFGYRLAGIRAETVDHQPVGWWRSFSRSWIGLLFGMLTWIWIGFTDELSVAFTRSKRALHDFATGTQVVHIAPPRKGALASCAAGVFLLMGSLFVAKDYLLQSYYIPSGSMEDTLRINDRMLVNNLCYRLRAPRAGEVIVFRAPDASGSGGHDFVNRCIGLPGEVIEMRGRQLFRNGKAVQEPYAKWSPPPEAPIHSYDMKIVDGKIYSREYVEPGQPGVWLQAPRIYEPDQERIERAKAEAVPAGHYIMLGDHRNNANDTHAYGFVPRANLRGPAMLIFWPFERMGNL